MEKQNSESETNNQYSQENQSNIPPINQPNPQQNQYNYNQNHPKPQDYTLEIISLVLGIIGLITSFIPCFALFALVFLVPSLILGILAINKTTKNNTSKSFAITATVIGGIGLLICIMWYAVLASAFTSVARDIENLPQGVNSYYNNTQYSEEDLNDSVKEDVETFWIEDTDDDY